MNVGESNYYLEIIEKVTAFNAYNEAIYSNKIYGYTWATRIIKGENETFTNGQKTYKKNIQFIVQFDKNINEKMILKDLESNEIYKILGVREYGYREALELNVEFIDKENEA